MGYKFVFVTLAGFHQMNHSIFNLAKDYSQQDMSAYSKLQSAEFKSISEGYTAIKHQREVGTGYFDCIRNIIMGVTNSTTAMVDSTENEQF